MKWERVGSLMYGTALLWVIVFTPTIRLSLPFGPQKVRVYVGSNILASFKQSYIQTAFWLTALAMLPSIKRFNKRRWLSIVMGLPWLSTCASYFTLNAFLFWRCISTEENIVQRNCLIRAFGVYLYVMACAIELGLHWNAVYRITCPQIIPN